MAEENKKEMMRKRKKNKKKEDDEEAFKAPRGPSTQMDPPAAPKCGKGKAVTHPGQLMERKTRMGK